MPLFLAGTRQMAALLGNRLMVGRQTLTLVV